MIRPNQTSVRSLCEELQNPRFGRYHIYFTHKVSRVHVKDLAEADTQESVAGVYEVAMDFCSLDAHIFVTTNAADQLIYDFTDYQKSLDSLLSVLISLDVLPSICHVRDSNLCQAFAKDLEKKWNQVIYIYIYIY